MEFEADNHILTRHDSERAEAGLEPQQYDAFVLYADDDIKFVKELTDKLENQYRLRLCLKERDLVAGVFEHDSVIRLISERCNRLVAIISPAFLNSASNRFFYSFAQFLGIEQRRRKIVPCLYTPCEIPCELKCYFIVDCKRVRFGNLWEKLRDSIQASVNVPGQRQNIHRSALQTIRSIPKTNDLKSSLQGENNTMISESGEILQNTEHLASENVNSILPDQKLNLTSTAIHVALSDTRENKKSKSITKQLRKLLKIPELSKKVVWNRPVERKVAVAN